MFNNVPVPDNVMEIYGKWDGENLKLISCSHQYSETFKSGGIWKIVNLKETVLTPS